MIVLIRCNDIVSDSRAKKYIDFYERAHLDYTIIAWDRLGQSSRLPRAIYCPVRSRYNQGGMRAIRDRIKWMWFILKTLLLLKDDLKIHACDLDAAFPAAVYKLLSRRHNFLLFDVFDWISDTLNNQGTLVSKVFAVMERFSTSQADHIVICEPERIRQIPYDISGKYSILQNIPAFRSDEFLYNDPAYRFQNDRFTLVYVGSFTFNRCLDELIEGAAQGYYNLNIAGYGDKAIVDKLEHLKNHPGIRYYGKVNYTDGLRIMYNSDIIYAMYSTVTPNHRFAAPNKYYEAMFVGKPLITTNGIIVADKVRENRMGYGIDESLESLIQLIQSLTADDVKETSEHAAALWQQYQSATDLYLNTTYSKVMQLNHLSES